MASSAYNQGLLELVNGTIAFASTDCYAVLVDSNYTFSAAHTTYANVSGDEIEDSDYAPVALSGKTVSIVSTDIVFDCSDISFGSEVTIDANGGAIVILAGTAASPQSTDRLLFHWDLPAPGASTNAPFAVNTPNGLYKVAINAE